MFRAKYRIRKKDGWYSIQINKGIWPFMRWVYYCGGYKTFHEAREVLTKYFENSEYWYYNKKLELLNRNG